MYLSAVFAGHVHLGAIRHLPGGRHGAAGGQPARDEVARRPTGDLTPGDLTPGDLPLQLLLPQLSPRLGSAGQATPTPTPTTRLRPRAQRNTAPVRRRGPQGAPLPKKAAAPATENARVRLPDQAREELLLRPGTQVRPARRRQPRVRADDEPARV